jgi:undecaprenyl phosphate N,N'-diacetylbacillosamine 1-phosphate transferase
MLITAILVRTKLGSPKLFPKRGGLDEKLFKIYKFRTMTDKEMLTESSPGC